MTTRTAIAAGVGAVALAATGFVAGSTDIAPLSATATTTVTATPMGCNDWSGSFTQKECFAAGTLRTALENLMPAVQFCKWKAANPGEWSRLKSYLSSGTPPTNIVTWLGGSIRDEMAAYLVAGGPPYSVPLNPLPPNACTGKLVTPPTVTGVTPGQTDVTVTVTTTP